MAIKKYKFFIIGLILICATILVGCKVNLNTKTEITINNNYKISATVLEINENTNSAWTERVAFYILFQNNMPANMVGVNFNLYDFDVFIDGYTIFDIYMTRDNQGSLTYTTLNPGEFMHITLYATINKNNVTEKITDSKIKLQIWDKTIYSNY